MRINKGFTIFVSSTLLPTEIEKLRKFQHNLQGRSDYKVTCILMLSMGNTPNFGASCLGIDISTYHYYSLYFEGGLDKLLENRCKGF